MVFSTVLAAFLQSKLAVYAGTDAIRHKTDNAIRNIFLSFIIESAH